MSRNERGKRAGGAHNLGISRQMAVTAAIVGVVLVIGAVMMAVVAYGPGQSAALIGTFLAITGGAVTSLVGALKSTEAADSISKIARGLNELAARVHAIDGKGELDT